MVNLSAVGAEGGDVIAKYVEGVGVGVCVRAVGGGCGFVLEEGMAGGG